MTEEPEEPIRTVAYFSMEIGLSSPMPTYSGGLGVLAGDMLRAAADLGLPLVGVTLLYRQGFFRQSLSPSGDQTETLYDWDPAEFLEPLDRQIELTVEGRRVRVRAWRFIVSGQSGGEIPVYLLDADFPENDPYDRALTGQLYGGDHRYRLCQEVLLGLGGFAMLRALGYDQLHTFHMNEGHSALLALALLDELTGESPLESASETDIERVRRHCVFTTHTPVPAGQDRFGLDLVWQVLGEKWSRAIERGAGRQGDQLNMTHLGLSFSRYTNGVARSHEETASLMYPGYDIKSITNGVHAATWVSEPFAELFDQKIPQWRVDRNYLRQATVLPLSDISQAHERAKRRLLDEVERRTSVRLDPSALTIGFARRAVAYKRADLLFSNPDALRQIVRDVGPLQVIYAGKAHPQDEAGKEVIRRVFAASESLRDEIPVVYLQEHDMDLGKILCSGVDLWLNNPQKPQEASGTSGMKAALNAVPSLSVLDGWWVEGWIEGVTGWSIGDDIGESQPEDEAASLQNKLGYVIMPLFYDRPEGYARVMRSTIALNGSFFNAQRMVEQYVENAYRFIAAGRRGRVYRPL